jgi:hypothetical protein
LAVFGFAGAAFADGLVNDIDGDLVADVELETLILVEGETFHVPLWARAVDGPDMGCNIDPGEVPAGFYVHSSTPNIVETAPTILISNCTDMFYLDVTAIAPGSTEITFELYQNPPGGGSFGVGHAAFTVIVLDTTPPVVHVPVSIVEEATGPDGAVVTFTATATDAVSGDLVATCSPGSGTLFPLGDTTVVCQATDGADNTGSASFMVTVVDTTAPALSLPDNIIDEADGPNGTEVTYPAVPAMDVVSGELMATCAPASGSLFSIGTTEVICTATDGAGNASSASFTVTIVDTIAPAIQVPSDMSVEATGPDGAVVTFTATATDAVSGDIEVMCEPASGSVFPIEETVVKCTATDEAGNSGTAAFRVTVVDTTPPVVTVPDDMNVEPTGPFGAVVTFGATAMDTVSGNVAVTCEPPSGVSFPFGETLVTCAATDGAGNTGTASFTVTVEPLTVVGFYPPVNNGGTVNTVKGGRTVPLKFEVFAGSTELTDTAVVASFRVTPVSCSTLTANADEIEWTTAGATELRYDATSGQFVQNWKAPTTPGCYRVTVTLVDGTTLDAYFQVR